MTVFGLGTGSSGLFAVADSLAKAEQAAIPSGLFVTLLIITFVLASVLAFMALLSLIQRADAERASTIALENLIGINTDYATLKD